MIKGHAVASVPPTRLRPDRVFLMPRVEVVVEVGRRLLLDDHALDAFLLHLGDALQSVLDLDFMLLRG